MRLIDADELIKKARTKFDWSEQVDTEDIINSPTIEAEPIRHGYWKNAGHDAWSHYRKCSVCGKLIVNINKTNYCSACGAKMDLEEK